MSRLKLKTQKTPIIRGVVIDPTTQATTISEYEGTYEAIKNLIGVCRVEYLDLARWFPWVFQPGEFLAMDEVGRYRSPNDVFDLCGKAFFGKAMIVGQPRAIRSTYMHKTVDVRAIPELLLGHMRYGVPTGNYVGPF